MALALHLITGIFYLPLGIEWCRLWDFIVTYLTRDGIVGVRQEIEREREKFRATSHMSPKSRDHVIVRGQKKVSIVRDDPKLLDDGGEIPRSQGRGWRLYFRL